MKSAAKAKRTGTIFRYAAARSGEEHGHYVVRCSAPDGSRPIFHLDPAPRNAECEENARAQAEEITAKLWANGEVAAPKRTGTSGSKPTVEETVEKYAKRWFDDRERRGLSSVGTDRGRIRNYVHPVIGNLQIRDVTRDDLRAVVEHLDNTIRQGGLRGEFTWSTATKVWGLVTKMFSDACNSKVAALRLRDDNPCAGIRGPDRGEKKGKQWLYPAEMEQLLACDDVPIRWRRLYALATYLYLRPGELAALEWDDVISAQRYVHVHQALSLRTGKVKPTKTGVTRKVPIHPCLVPLIDALRKEGGAGRVIQHTHENKDIDHGFPPIEDLAGTLRMHLLRAGVRRAALHEERSTTKRITFYDLRATGITWEVLAGTDHIRIMQRAGHRNFSTTQGYIREAEAVGIDAGAPFPALPRELSLILSRQPQKTRNAHQSGSEMRRPQRDLNPCYSLERAVSWAG